MNRFTKKKLMLLLPWAIVTGFVLTFLFTGQENFKQLNSSCVVAYFNAPQVKTVNCSTLDQGYPFRFLRTVPDLTSENGQILDISAAPKISTYRLAADVVIWSAVSLVILAALAPKASKKSGR